MRRGIDASWYASRVFLSSFDLGDNTSFSILLNISPTELAQETGIVHAFALLHIFPEISALLLREHSEYEGHPPLVSSYHSFTSMSRDQGILIRDNNK